MGQDDLRKIILVDDGKARAAGQPVDGIVRIFVGDDGVQDEGERFRRILTISAIRRTITAAGVIIGGYHRRLKRGWRSSSRFTTVRGGRKLIIIQAIGVVVRKLDVHVGICAVSSAVQSSEW